MPVRAKISIRSAVSRWRLELNGKKGSINLNDLLDITIVVKYTALQGGPSFAEAVKGMLKPYQAPRFFDMQFDFPQEWNEFLDGDLHPHRAARIQT